MIILNILGILLKIIGIVLLLLLLLLLIVLFVPIRYRAKTEKNDAIAVTAEVSYFLRLIRMPILLRDKKLIYRLKVLCFTLFDSESRTGKKKKKTKEKEKETKENGGKTKERKEAKGRKKEESSERGTQKEIQEARKCKEEAQREVQEAGKYKEDMREETWETGKSGENEAKEEKKAKKTEKRTKKLKKKKKIKSDQSSQTEEAKEEKPQDGAKPKNKILKFLKRCKQSYDDIKEFLQNEINRNGIKYAKKTIFRLLKHVLPYKIEGKVRFGTGDPYSMGQALSALGIFYGLYARTFRIEADFETDHFRLEGDVFLKGRIRIISVLMLLLKLWFKGKIRSLIKNIKKLKEKLAAPAATE